MQFDIEPEDYEVEEPIKNEEFVMMIKWGANDHTFIMRRLPGNKLCGDYFVSLPNANSFPIHFSYYPMSKSCGTKAWHSSVRLYSDELYDLLNCEFPSCFTSSFSGSTAQEAADKLFKSLKADWDVVSKYFKEIIGPLENALWLGDM